jgi:BASS family bile acid:Na+ symporter
MTLLTRLFPLWVILVALAAFFAPAPFVPVAAYLTPLFAAVMLSMGLTLTVSDFTYVLSRPAAVVAGVVLHYLIMPLAAFGLSRLFGLDPILSAGMILVGSVASGTASTLIVYIARGDVALSVTIGVFSTLASVILTPLWTSLLTASSIQLDAIDMGKTIAFTLVLPVLVGTAIAHVFPKIAARINRWTPLISMAAVLLIIASIVAKSGTALTHIGPALIAAVMLHNLIGLAGGYWGGRLLRLNEAGCRTLAIEVGMQNSGMAVVLAKLYFGAAAAIPGILFSIWHNVSGSALAGHWARQGDTAPSRGDGSSETPT